MLAAVGVVSVLSLGPQHRQSDRQQSIYLAPPPDFPDRPRSNAGTALRELQQTLAASEHSLDASGLRLLNDQVRLQQDGGGPVIMHIAKTSVDSLCLELRAEGMWDAPEKEDCVNNGGIHVLESCLVELPAGFTATYVRSPREHVVSQYTHCRFVSAQGHVLIPGHNGSDGGEFSKACFEEWLQHTAVGTDSYDCYHPFNLQSRHFTCSTGPHFIDSEAEREPDVNAVLDALASLEFVGITELYDESWCALQHKLRRELPADCTCTKIGKDLARLWHTGERYSRHNLPPHPSSGELSPAALQLVDKATTVDRLLYANATARFLGELCALQRASGTQLFCLGRMEMLRNMTQYIEGLWDAVEGAAHECLTDTAART
jgi:hypothetical protein